MPQRAHIVAALAAGELFATADSTPDFVRIFPRRYTNIKHEADRKLWALASSLESKLKQTAHYCTDLAHPVLIVEQDRTVVEFFTPNLF